MFARPAQSKDLQLLLEVFLLGVIRPLSGRGIVLYPEKSLVIKIGWGLRRTTGVVVNPRLSLIFVVLAVAFLLIRYRAFSQGSESESPQEPVFSLGVEVPDVIRAVSEIVLETKLTNISQQEITFSGWCPKWTSYLIDVRDRSGNRVPKTTAGENVICHEPEVITYSPRPVVLHPGQSLTNYLMLDKLFQLSQAGEYSVSISDHYRQLGRDEIGTGIMVFDDSERLVPPMDRPEPDNSKPKEHYPSGDLSIADILPGETAERIRVIRSAFDVSEPGTYHVKVSLLDPETSLPVQSNEASFKVEPSKPPADRARKIPPFIVTVRKYPPGFDEDSPYTFLICMSNISDHEIRLDNVITKDLFKFVDGKGNVVSLPEKWHEIQTAPLRLPEVVAPTVQGNWASVEARWALCGGTHADAVFSGAVPGA